MRQEVMKVIANEHKINNAAVVLWGHFCVMMMLLYNAHEESLWIYPLMYLFAWPFVLIFSLFYVPIRNIGIRNMTEHKVDTTTTEGYELYMAEKYGVPKKIYAYMIMTEAALCMVAPLLVELIEYINKHT